ncbi:MAG: hypothetical protein IPO78_06920 [Saprospiraceae bacterium]|nr:hypothetical protein [Saprospiraceae bacterium]MBK8449598.1 hypothetical protein [Saprospiraceae bacterium]MBK8484337.1 hypothetical protein [Saprospiraceae bacterium]MBK9221725.1 hypothetical protein [Saprospiraceae bacterium]MBK9721338.1 hypothetical protein [Saprospiraceae bacterium]
MKLLGLISLVESPIAGDFMRETGKINVVFGVLTIIFIGIALFLIHLELKIRRIEKRINNDENK